MKPQAEALLRVSLKRLAQRIQPSLRGRVFALLVGLTLCACAGATATYWLATHYLDATDMLRQVNLGQQVSALKLSEQMLGLEADALAARQNPERLKDFMARRQNVARVLSRVHASEPMEAGRELIDHMIDFTRAQAATLHEFIESQPGQGAELLARAVRQREAAQDAASELFALHGRDADLGVSAMRTLARAATTASLFVIPAGAVLGLLLGWVLLRQVLGPIRSLARDAALGPSLKLDEAGGAAQSAGQGSADEVRAVGDLVQGLLRDVDQTHTLLQESRLHLMQSEKLALVGKLAAGVAHSVRNPLTSVKMRLFSLERGLDLSPTQREDFEVISEEIRHLDTIVRNFLEFSRPPRPKFQHLSPSDVVDMTLNLLKYRLETYGVDVRLVRERPLPEVDVDPEQLKEALVNLILNACDAMGENGRIEITEQIGFVDPLGRVAVLQLSDSGPGIPPEIQDQVFQPFYSTKEEGTGLGLAIAKRILEEHGGYIHLKPSDRQGATFVLVLPLREKVWLRS
ncbi:MAG: ATP-binding protein [Humidesulfovibrio sp.]|nr:ATP-binding protein [Humidesulfovibrio sp.]